MGYTVGMQYAVGVSAKRSTHTVDLANMVVGTVTFSAIRSNPHSGYAVGTQYTVGMQYAVGVSTKRSTHTVDLANMVVGTVTFSAKRSLYPPCSGCSGCAVCSRCAVRSRC